jgi:signal transduction histidine kinase
MAHASTFEFAIQPGLDEDYVWTTSVRPALGALPESVIDIWQYCVTEMVNNAIDHSGGTLLTVSTNMQDTRRAVVVTDDGIGVFRKIQAELHLAD